MWEEWLSYDEEEEYEEDEPVYFDVVRIERTTHGRYETELSRWDNYEDAINDVIRCHGDEQGYSNPDNDQHISTIWTVKTSEGYYMRDELIVRLCEICSKFKLTIRTANSYTLKSSQKESLSYLTINPDGTYNFMEWQQFVFNQLIENTTEEYRESSGGWVTASKYLSCELVSRDEISNEEFYKIYKEVEQFISL
jgi:hypothetical protein